MTASLLAPGPVLTVLCDARHLTDAIGAVAPHNGFQKDQAKRTRIRLVVDVDTMYLGFAGASLVTAAVAVVPVVEIDVPDGMLPLRGLLDVDIMPKHLSLVAKVFEGVETIQTIALDGGRVVVASGALTADTVGMAFLASGAAMGTDQVPGTGAPGYDGPLAALLESWCLGEVEAGGIVSEVSEWLREAGQDGCGAVEGVES